PDYGAMAVYFGNDATYHALQSRFREYRRMAETMQGAAGPVAPTTPIRNRNGAATTPRSGRGRVTKSVSAKKTSHNGKLNPETPTKKGGVKKESNADDPIVLDDDSDVFVVKSEDRENAQNTTTSETLKPEPVIEMMDMFTTEQDREVQNLQGATIAQSENTESQRQYQPQQPQHQFQHQLPHQPQHQLQLQPLATSGQESSVLPLHGMTFDNDDQGYDEIII
ncbi:hypothetical protein FQN49_007995, partial [Arthroderma sp. PD_2]